ncbi:MAG: hypothetical protein V1492_06460 [Candidatus Micrarchaeota archaeon]
MINFIAFVLAFFAGLLVKWVDWLDDDEKSKSPLKYVLALAYGLLIGYLISTSSFGEAFLGALLAQVFARKVDTKAHMLGFAVAVLALPFFGFPPASLLFIAYFFLLAFMDEDAFGARFSLFEGHRPILELGALLLLLIGRWDYAAGIFLFDIGYLLLGKYMSSKAGKKLAGSAPKRKAAK